MAALSEGSSTSAIRSDSLVAVYSLTIEKEKDNPVGNVIGKNVDNGTIINYNAMKFFDNQCLIDKLGLAGIKGFNEYWSIMSNEIHDLAKIQIPVQVTATYQGIEYEPILIQISMRKSLIGLPIKIFVQQVTESLAGKVLIDPNKVKNIHCIHLHHFSQNRITKIRTFIISLHLIWIYR